MLMLQEVPGAEFCGCKVFLGAFGNVPVRLIEEAVDLFKDSFASCQLNHARLTPPQNTRYNEEDKL